MRLTLRTLLAYLDNTLEPQDAEVLKTKLAESGFATGLVQRIRAGLVNPTMAAPSPDAAGPNDDANVIGEYLDSTLPTEQVAEIERACLESDVRLAEAAACHQVLTMVLGNKADVPPELRKRIYELPEREIERIAATSQRFSSLSIDDAPPTKLADVPSERFSDTPPTATASPLASRSGTVTPVGPADSGVSDAPTRLRESGVIAATLAKTNQPAMAGAKPRDVNDTAIYGGAIRPSRITPWLVTLATAGVLLFALSKLFAPVLQRDVAMIDPDADVIAPAMEPAIQREAPPAQASPMVDIVPAPTPEIDQNADRLPAPEMLPAPTPAPVPDEPAQVAVDDIVPTMPQPSDAAKANGAKPDDDDFAAVASAPPTPAPKPAPVPVPPPAEELMAPAVADEKPPALQDVASEVATIVSDQALVATNKGAATGTTKWVRLKRGMTVVPGFPVVCAPTFRATMTSVSGFEITLVGPVEVVWELRVRNANDGDANNGDAKAKLDPILHVLSGRILVRSTKADSTLMVMLGDEAIDMTMADPESVAAASIKHFRSPGLDPFDAASRVDLTGVLCVQGATKLTSGDKAQPLQTGQQWVKRGPGDAKVSPVDTVPVWVDPPDPTATSLAAGARDGLLELINGQPSLEMALREATLFRRSEVAALAAESLLHLGQGDIYFGSDGILSEPKQRAYWPEHYLELIARFDRGPETAEQLRASIEKMDAANAKSLLRVLTGYAPKQLEVGGDAELVEMLDSESMAVRVLALEHLHKITGTTLYFRAEQDNAVRRAPGIKKWQTRQRKGEIRWGEG